MICDESIKNHEEVSRLLPKLRHLMRVDPDQEDMIAILKTLSSLCVLQQVSHDSDEPNLENQTMLDNFGLFSRNWLKLNSQ